MTYMMVNGNAVMLSGPDNTIQLELRRTGENSAAMSIKNANLAPTMADIYGLAKVFWSQAEAFQLCLTAALEPNKEPCLFVEFLPKE